MTSSSPARYVGNSLPTLTASLDTGSLSMGSPELNSLTPKKAAVDLEKTGVGVMLTSQLLKARLPPMPCYRWLHPLKATEGRALASSLIITSSHLHNHQLVTPPCFMILQQQPSPLPPVLCLTLNPSLPTPQSCPRSIPIHLLG